jgi:uncharacterized membrane protein YphA (DoxX/SURF4 family)
MTNLDLLMEFLLAAAFLWIGSAQILSYRRRPRALGADNRRLPLGLPYAAVLAVGVFEIVAALALVASLAAPPIASLALFAATALALITFMAAILNARRHRPAAPSVALFLMSLFVIVGHTI